MMQNSNIATESANWGGKSRTESTAWGGKIFFLVLLVFASSFAFAGKKSKELDRTPGDTQVDVIVQYASAPSDDNIMKAHNKGAKFKNHLGLIKASVYRVAAGNIDKMMADDPSITYVSPDRAVSGASDYASVAIGADIARSYGYTGSGVGVAVIDSGITAVSDLKSGTTSRVVYSQNFVTSSATGS